jgi:hypothetical protein
MRVDGAFGRRALDFGLRIDEKARNRSSPCRTARACV